VSLARRTALTIHVYYPVSNRIYNSQTSNLAVGKDRTTLAPSIDAPDPHLPTGIIGEVELLVGYGSWPEENLFGVVAAGDWGRAAWGVVARRWSFEVVDGGRPAEGAGDGVSELRV